MFKMGVKKSLITKKNHSPAPPPPPRIKWSVPFKVLDKFETSELDLDLQGQIGLDLSRERVGAGGRHLFFANAKKGPY